LFTGIGKTCRAPLPVCNRKIFEQEQIERGVELGLGVSGTEEIEIITDDEDSRRYAGKLREILMEG